MTTEVYDPIGTGGCVASESRICFAVAWYATEADADRAAEKVRAKGRTYNGGYFHGAPCGREPDRDRSDAHPDGPAYAVTH